MADGADIASGHQDHRDAQHRHQVQHRAAVVERHHDPADTLDQKHAVVPSHRTAAKLDDVLKDDGATLALARHVGRERPLNRQGEMRSTSSTATGRPSAPSSTAGSLFSHAPGSNPLTIGLMAATAPPAPRICRIKPAVRKVLPISVPVAVMKTAVIAFR